MLSKEIEEKLKPLIKINKYIQYTFLGYGIFLYLNIPFQFIDFTSDMIPAFITFNFAFTFIVMFSRERVRRLKLKLDETIKKENKTIYDEICSEVNGRVESLATLFILSEGLDLISEKKVEEKKGYTGTEINLLSRTKKPTLSRIRGTNSYMPYKSSSIDLLFHDDVISIQIVGREELFNKFKSINESILVSKVGRIDPDNSLHKMRISCRLLHENKELLFEVVDKVVDKHIEDSKNRLSIIGYN